MSQPKRNASSGALSSDDVSAEWVPGVELFSVRMDLNDVTYQGSEDTGMWRSRRGYEQIRQLDACLLALLAEPVQGRNVALVTTFARLLAVMNPDVLRITARDGFGRDSLGLHHCCHSPSLQWFDQAVGETGTSVASLFDPEEEEKASIISDSSLASSSILSQSFPRMIATAAGVPPSFAYPFTMGEDPLGRTKALMHKTVGCHLRLDDWCAALCDHPSHYPEDNLLDGEVSVTPQPEPDPVGESFPFAAGFSANLVAYWTLWEKEDRLNFICGCCASDDVDCVRLALEADGAEDSCLKATTKIGLNALMVAAEWGAVRVLELLLNRFPETYLRVAHPATGQQPLHYACRGGCTTAVEVLLRYGADPNVPSANAFLSPLHIAAGQLNYATVRLLLENGADPTATSKSDSTPLHSVCSTQQVADLPAVQRALSSVTDDVEAVQIAILALFAEKCDRKQHAAGEVVAHAEHEGDKVASFLDAQTVHGLTPLHLALRYNRVQLGLQLIKLGCDVKLKDLNGNRPLHVATMYCRSENGRPLIRALIEHGAKPTAKNCVGRSPIDIAKEMEKAGDGAVMAEMRAIQSERGGDCAIC